MDRRHTSVLHGSTEEETAVLLQRSASDGGQRTTDFSPFRSLPPRNSEDLGREDGNSFLLESGKLKIMDGEDEDFCLCRRCRTSSNLSASHRPNGRSTSRTYSRTWSGASSGSNVLSINADGADDVPFLLNDSIQLGADSDSCRCHAKKPISSGVLRARKQLIASSTLCLAFMIAEIIGGYMSNSLAIMTDAAHLLSDLASFLISLFAIWFGQKAPTKKMSFGYHRAEILGAVVSVLIIWALTCILVYMAIERIRTNDYEINADAMLIVSGLGVAINIVMGIVLHGFCCGGAHLHSHGGGSSHTHAHGHSHGGDQNINVRAAFIHVLGDLLQSVGVLIAAYIIKYKPEYKLADPICTFLFSALVLFTTFSIMKDAVHILMEGFPHDLSYPDIIKELQSIPGVKTAHSLHIWCLTTDRKALSVHLAIDQNANSDIVLQEAEAFVRSKYSIYQSTIQVERFVPEVMSSCVGCIKGPE